MAKQNTMTEAERRAWDELARAAKKVQRLSTMADKRREREREKREASRGK